MSGLPSQHSTLAIAQESLKMGKETGDRNFKLMAMAMMIGTGVATMLHAGLAIYRDLFRRPGQHDHGKGDAPPPPARSEHTTAPAEESAPTRRWTHRAELADRTPQDDHAQAAHHHAHHRHR